MMNAKLPQSPEREHLLAFWASVSLLTGLSVGVVLFLSGLLSLSASAVSVAGAAALLFLAGRLRERGLDRAYRRWNRLAGGYAERSRRVVTGIWYWTVFTAVGRTGGAGLSLEDSAWRSRGTLLDRAYGDPGGSATGRDAVGGIRDFARWAVRSGRTWTLFLLPMLVVLRALETRGSKSSAPDIYTLY
jgi:hypothetical protein